MVATRGHPSGLPEPTDTPTKRSLRSSSAAVVSIPATPSNGSPKHSSPTASSTRPRRSSRTPTSSSDGATWAHTPSKLTILWMAVSLPLVIWDTGYVLLRPYSMPGGSLHWPLWVPYDLYGTVDHMYGFKQWNLNNGWTAAQGTLNAIETTAYLVYLYLVYAYGRTEPKTKGRGAPDAGSGLFARLSESRTVEGRVAAWAVLLMFGTSLVTFAKTVLYWLIQVFSGFDDVRHNTVTDLIFLFIIPNAAWLVLPAYLIYVFGAEIIEGLDYATVAKKES